MNATSKQFCNLNLNQPWCTSRTNNSANESFMGFKYLLSDILLFSFIYITNSKPIFSAPRLNANDTYFTFLFNICYSIDKVEFKDYYDTNSDVPLYVPLLCQISKVSSHIQPYFLLRNVLCSFDPILVTVDLVDNEFYIKGAS